MGVAQTTPDKFLLVLCTPEKRIPESLSFHHFPRHTRFPSLLSEFCKSGPFAAGHLAASGSSPIHTPGRTQSDRKDKGRESAQPPCGSIFARSRFKNSARPISILLFPFAFDRRFLHRFSIVIVGSFRHFVLRSG